MSIITLNINECISEFTLDVLNYDDTSINDVQDEDIIIVTGMASAETISIICENSSPIGAADLEIGDVSILSDASGMFSLVYVDGAVPQTVLSGYEYSVNALMGTVPTVSGTHDCVIEIDQDAPNAPNPFTFTLRFIIP